MCYFSRAIFSLVASDEISALTVRRVAFRPDSDVKKTAIIAGLAFHARGERFDAREYIRRLIVRKTRIFEMNGRLS